MADLKDTLIEKKIPEAQVNKIIAYIESAKKSEEGKDANKRPVTNNDAQTLYRLIMKYWNLGLAIDGVNVVITGKNMAMVTFNGYKNKVLATYPETEFDVQLVKEGDTFKFSKDSGHVKYTHDLADPFGTAKSKIVGAYVVFKNKRGEFLETLNRDDYEKMKKASKQAYLWGDWESEFWLKSVIKRACKRHFYDVVDEIDKVDNDDYGLLLDKPPVGEDEDAIQLALDSIRDTESLDDFRETYKGLGKMANHPKVMEAARARKAELEAVAPPAEEATDENTAS